MKRYQIILNGSVVAHYDRVNACERMYNIILETCKAERGPDFPDTVDIYDSATGTRYIDFPLTEENESH